MPLQEKLNQKTNILNILISAGPTIEKIDPVRFISNFSSGKMGYALAEASAKNGHNTILVSGPVNIPPPDNVKIIKVQSAKDMFREIRKHSKISDIIIMAAAVADYKPFKTAKNKIKKNRPLISLTLRKTEDILHYLGINKKENQIIVGFAAESQKLVSNAVKKLNKKKIDWIIANDIGKNDMGFASDNNSAIMISRNGDKIDFPLQSKKKMAEKIIRILIKPFES